MHKLFVYGTLRTGKGKPAHIRGILWDLGPFPAVTNIDEVENRIPGEIIDVTDEELKNFDIYEGVPNLYQRMQTETTMDDEVWVYVWNKSIHPDIHHPIDEWDYKKRKY